MPSLFAPAGTYPTTYFPPTYFPVGGVVPSLGSAAPIAGDPEIMDDIVDRLRATGAFEAVEWGFPINDPIPADMLPCAIAELVDWQDADTWDESTSLTTSRFTVTIATKNRDPREAQSQALQLSSVVANAINRRKLANTTWVPFTRIGQGRFDRRKHPETRLILSGSYRYEVNRSYNHYEYLDTSGA